MGITTVEAAKEYAEKAGYALSDKAERVVKALVKTGGKCPCVAVNAPECPCPSHVCDIGEDGKCHCNLFIRKDQA
jgi:ferredoxin-thioredoxin reductase catalytic subunit